MINQTALLGRYRPIDSFLHNLDARSKLTVVALFFVLALLPATIWFYLSANILLLALLFFSGLPLTVILKNLKPLLIILIITALFHLLFGKKTGDMLFSYGWFSLYNQAVHDAVYYSLRLMTFIVAAFFITLTTSPSALSEALARMIRPLGKLKVPVHDLALILFMVLRFIPILYDEFMLIRNAQTVRGVRFDGSFITKVKKTASILIPVFNSAIRRADNLAMALQLRAYDGSGQRTYYGQSRITVYDILFIFSSLIIVIPLYLWLR